MYKHLRRVHQHARVRVRARTTWASGSASSWARNLEALVIPHRRVHLDLESVDLEQLRAFARIVLAGLGAARLVERLEDLGEAAVLGAVQPQLGQLQIGLEPQALLWGK